MTPYLYSLEYEANQTGSPIMRALVYEFQNDPNVYDESFEFMFGRDILVANVLEPGATSRRVYLPAGSNWYSWSNNYWTDNYTCYEGGQYIDVPVDMSSIPMFIRSGAVIPIADNQLMSMEHDHIKALRIIIAPDGKERTFTYYDDDGVTNEYLNGKYRRTDIHVSGDSVVKVAFDSHGSYVDQIETLLIEMIRKDRSPFWVTIGETKLEHYLNRKKFDEAMQGWYYSQTKRAVLIKYPNPCKNITLTVSFEDFDLIGM